MPHFAKPWLRKGRGWYLQLNGKQIKLGKDREAAFTRYHKLMQEQKEVQAEKAESDSVLGIFETFLEWCSRYRSPDTYEWYQKHLQSFAETISKQLLACQLKPFHVEKWVSQHDWSSGTQRGAMRAVQRAINWAVKQGLIDRSPLLGLEKPPPGKREVVIDEATYRKMLKLSADQEFQDILRTHWETGCRPQESLRVEARHVDTKNHRWVFPPNESKGKKRHRIVYLNAAAWAITKRCMKQNPSGPIFRNTRGEPWQPYAVGCRFFRMKESFKVRYCLYNFRHTWITRMLKAGVDPLTLATLAGHVDTSMLTRIYAHISADTSYLQKAVRTLSA